MFTNLCGVPKYVSGIGVLMRSVVTTKFKHGLDFKDICSD